MTPLESANQIRQSLFQSNLHFFINESPHSMWITIRKRFRNNHFNPHEKGSTDEASEHAIDAEHLVKQVITEDDYKKLKEKYAQLENDFESLKSDFDCEVSEHEAVIKERNKLSLGTSSKVSVIEQLKQELDALKSELGSKDNEIKKNYKLMKVKEKEMHDLKKEHEKVKDDYVQVNRDFKELTAKVNKEEKDLKRKEKSKQKKDFLNNLKTEAKQNEFTCDICENTFETTGKLKLHIRSIHLKNDSTQTEEKMLENKTVQTSSIEYTCVKETQCPDEKMCLMKDKGSDTKPRFKFETKSCSSCRNTFPSESHLIDHRKSCLGTKTQFSPLSNPTPFPIGFPSSTAFPFWFPPR